MTGGHAQRLRHVCTESGLRVIQFHVTSFFIPARGGHALKQMMIAGRLSTWATNGDLWAFVEECSSR